MFWTIFLIGIVFTAIIFITLFIAMFLVHRWTANKTIVKSRQKAKESEPVNLYGMHLSEDFIYTRELERRIKESREELRMLMKERNGGEEI